MNSHPSLASPHSDVLTATPSDAPTKFRLVEEIKRRGKGSVLSKNWPEADLLYAKGIELLESVGDGDEQEDRSSHQSDLAILYSNRSLALFYLTKLSDSRDAAQTATSLDPDYVKAYWRLGQACAAMEDWEDALSAYSAAHDVDAHVGGGKMAKALGKEVDKCRVKIEQERLLVMEGKFDEQGGEGGTGAGSSSSKTADPPIKKPATANQAATATAATATAKSSTSSAAKKDTVKDAADGEFTQSDHVRGYKIVNGKKTSYFHHEMTEEEKKLIGDIAPKKIDASAAAPAAAEPAVEGSSAWNKAGTWEEKDITTWAVDTLSSTLLSCSYDVPGGVDGHDAFVKVVKAKKMDVHDGGHASVAAVRGKKRYIYEFGYELEWELEAGDADADLRGKLVLPDIDGTVAAGEWHDVSDFTVDGGIPNARRAFLMKNVRDDGLRKVVEDKIDEWVTLLKATY